MTNNVLKYIKAKVQERVRQAEHRKAMRELASLSNVPSVGTKDIIRTCSTGRDVL